MRNLTALAITLMATMPACCARWSPRPPTSLRSRKDRPSPESLARPEDGRIAFVSGIEAHVQRGDSTST